MDKINQIFEKKNIPNLLTLSRVVLIPLFVVLFYTSPTAALVAFIIAAATDYLDGYLARKWNVTSDFGKFLDPVTDKLIVATALILLATASKASAVLVLAIILREIYVSALREFTAEKKKRVDVSQIGKIKTTVQMLAVIFLFMEPALGNFLLLTAVVLSVVSAVQYTLEVLPLLKAKPAAKKASTTTAKKAPAAKKTTTATAKKPAPKKTTPKKAA